jgi:site-specific DNA-methyltransferase (adenine-specific)
MRGIPDDCIDSIVTDPPYELGFMGKKWDSTGIAYNVDMWRECLRVLKPGGHLLSFGGTRTYHRMACAIEDAGFEIRDMIEYFYGSGFPKSMDISKQIDKKAGAERKVIGKREVSKDYTRNGLRGDMLVLGNAKATKINITEPTTPEAKQWDGWGTALKPAHEPIVVARKPLSEKNVVDNVLKWGTGGINVDGCRIELNGEKNPSIARYNSTPQKGNNGWEHKNRGGNFNEQTKKSMEQGRFPANLIFDEEAAAMLDEQTGTLKSGKVESWHKSDTPTGNGNTHGKMKGIATTRGFGDSGGASRFFYCAKASKKERGEGNNHPTVKPLALMRYLVRLITPPGGIVLDPFTGSGTTLIASKLEGFFYLGIEREQQYCEIARQRVEQAQMQGKLFAEIR